jgi:hypothetical protein
MKNLQEYIIEKMIYTSSNSNINDIIDVKIKDIEHLKTILSEYYKRVSQYELKISKILTKPVKWHSTKYSMLRTFAHIDEIEVGDHFKIEFLHNRRVVYRLCAAEYKDTFIIQQTFCIRSSSNPDEIIGLTNKYAYSPENPLAPGRNLLEWLNDLKSIKLSDGKLPFANGEFLRLLELDKDE